MKNFLMIVFLVNVVLGFASFVSGEQQKSLLRAPQFEQPKAGNTVDTSFKVTMEGVPAGANCVSVMQEEATILISRDILEYLKIAKPMEPKTEEERIASINGRRAEILLDNLQNIKDDFGCLIVQESFDDDARYLISELLKSGQVGVINNATSQPVDHIYVRFKAFVAGPLAGKGDIHFSFTERSAPFFTVLWWVS
ncbi:MAG: hypothetical protein H6Q52_1075 [Deltaproteobacteria bacterium]|nr:hypothetical protein [Deltaproteobacteria bacterium]